MSLADILSRYQNAPSDATDNSVDHFNAAAQELPPNVVGQGLAEAFRSDQTPPFGQMIGQLFGQSNPQQKANLLNELLGSLGPGALSGLGGGIFGRVLGVGRGNTDAAVPTTVTPDQASQVSADHVSEIAAHAEQRDPSIIDRLGGFYAQHPQLVRTLGSAALAIALGTIANRTRA